MHCVLIVYLIDYSYRMAGVTDSLIEYVACIVSFVFASFFPQVFQFTVDSQCIYYLCIQSILVLLTFKSALLISSE